LHLEATHLILFRCLFHNLIILFYDKGDAFLLYLTILSSKWLKNGKASPTNHFFSFGEVSKNLKTEMKR
jgi:hypothetical protein